MVRRFVFLVALAGAALSPSMASAFCRSTACTCKSDAPLPDENGLPRSTCGLPDGDCPRDEHNCHTTGSFIVWPGACVGCSPNLRGTVQLEPDDWTAAFERAFDAWQLADCGGGEHPSIRTYLLRPTTCGVTDFDPQGPNVNSISFTDSGWTGPQTSRNLDAVLARTTVRYLPSGEVMKADIAINSARKDFSVKDSPGGAEQDLVSVLTHEVGHLLGLDHSDDPSAVMYWKYAEGSVNRTLSADDVRGICTIYPPTRTASCDPTPRGGLRDTCGTSPKVTAGCNQPAEDGASVAPLALAFASALFWRKRRHVPSLAKGKSS